MCYYLSMTTPKRYKSRLSHAEGSGDVLIEHDGKFIAMQHQVTAVFDKGRVIVKMTLLPPSNYVVTSVEFVGSTDEPLSSSELRLPLNNFIAEVTQIFTMNIVEQEDGTWASRGRISMTEANQIARRAPKKRITPDWLRGEIAPIVAQCERDGIPVGPVIAKKYFVAQVTARSWVAKLRELEAKK